jgi:hypothetical protein
MKIRFCVEVGVFGDEEGHQMGKIEERESMGLSHEEPPDQPHISFTRLVTSEASDSPYNTVYPPV